MLSHFSRQILRHIDVGPSQQFGLGQHLFPILVMGKTNQNWTATSDLWSSQHPGNFQSGDRSNDLYIVLENLVNLHLQLRRNFRQEIWFDTIDKQVVPSGFVNFVHFLVEVIVDSGDGVNLVR